jgi:hypothetical protein
MNDSDCRCKVAVMSDSKGRYPTVPDSTHYMSICLTFGNLKVFVEIQYFKRAQLISVTDSSLG